MGGFTALKITGVQDDGTFNYQLYEFNEDGATMVPPLLKPIPGTPDYQEKLEAYNQRVALEQRLLDALLSSTAPSNEQELRVFQTNQAEMGALLSKQNKILTARKDALETQRAQLEQNFYANLRIESLKPMRYPSDEDLRFADIAQTFSEGKPLPLNEKDKQLFESRKKAFEDQYYKRVDDELKQVTQYLNKNNETSQTIPRTEKPQDDVSKVEEKIATPNTEKPQDDVSKVEEKIATPKLDSLKGLNILDKYMNARDESTQKRSVKGFLKSFDSSQRSVRTKQYQAIDEAVQRLREAQGPEAEGKALNNLQATLKEVQAQIQKEHHLLGKSSLAKVCDDLLKDVTSARQEIALKDVQDFVAEKHASLKRQPGKP